MQPSFLFFSFFSPTKQGGENFSYINSLSKSIPELNQNYKKINKNVAYNKEPINQNLNFQFKILAFKM